MIRSTFAIPAAALVWLALTTGASAIVRHVNVELTSGAGTGASWADAYRGRDGFARALADAAAGDEIWVARGTYTPVLPVSAGGTGSRTTTFALKSGVASYGGFSGAGTETERTQRDPVSNPTILSGDINQDDSPFPSTTGWSENSAHVVSAGLAAGPVAGATAILDGFTLRSAFANLAADNDRGGGLVILNGSAPTLRNLIISNNRVTFGGGGIYIRQSSPSLEDCRVENNIGGSFGGGCDMATNCSPVWTRCAIIGNTAARAGGIEAFSNCFPTFTNCLIARNTATGANGGGAFFVQSSTVTLRLCTIVFNAATTGPGGAITGASAVMSNCIVAGNTGSSVFSVTPSAQHCCVAGGIAGAGNINATPAFLDATANDFRLAAGSVGIDAGSSLLVPTDATSDLAGRPRRVDDPDTADIGAGEAPIVDMGCYEFQPACAADFNGIGGVTVQDVFDFLAAYFAADPSADINGTGGVTLQDIFDFLAVYFAGC